MSQTKRPPSFLGLTPKKYFFGVVIPAMAIISVAVGFLDVTFGLIFAAIGIGGFGSLIWASHHQHRLWALNTTLIIAMTGWLLYRDGLAGLPEALARLGGLLLLMLLIVVALKFSGIKKR